MHAPDTVRYTPQIKDDYDGLDTPLQIGFFIFFFQLGASHPSLSHFLCSVQAQAILQLPQQFKTSLSILCFFFFIFDRKLGS